MNAGKWQVLWWPRRVIAFWRPRRAQRAWALYQHIYRFIVYVWPVEVRRLR